MFHISTMFLLMFSNHDLYFSQGLWLLYHIFQELLKKNSLIFQSVHLVPRDSIFSYCVVWLCTVLTVYRPYFCLNRIYPCFQFTVFDTMNYVSGKFSLFLLYIYILSVKENASLLVDVPLIKLTYLILVSR